MICIWILCYNTWPPEIIKNGKIKSIPPPKREPAWQFIVLLLDLQLPMQSVPITTDVVSLNLGQSKVYNIM